MFDYASGGTQRKELQMDNVMTVGEILDALYDSIGCSWVEEGHTFVDEVAAWVESNRPLEEDGDTTEESDHAAR